jgi:hypothetical protein
MDSIRSYLHSNLGLDLDCNVRLTDKMLEQFSVPKGLNKEYQKMMLDPLGYDRIKDIDETYNRNRRKTDNQLKEKNAKNKEFQRRRVTV